jgi:SnoaL-like domain
MTLSLTGLSLEALIDRELIRDCLMRYCRGADRCDLDLIHSAYWPDATDLHATPGRAAMNAHEMFAKLIPRMRKMDQTMHTLGNIFIRAEDRMAYVESYFHAYHRVVNEAGTRHDIITAGRYIDRMERRRSEWRILHRVVVIDWFREFADSCDWEKGTFGGPCLMGARAPDDESYRVLEKFGATG